MKAPNDATARQIKAARPNVSTWVAANAGSGKTRVLTDRVARLLLDGVAPERILCLTYTKAAASEMQNRLFKRLGDWAMKPSGELRNELIELGLSSDADALDLKKARRLFARAIEAPGGLKIQTIHSFCASILRRFPLEANVAPQFSEMEDRAAKLLQEEIVEEMASGPHLKLVDDVARYLSDQTFEDFTTNLVRNRSLFQHETDIDDQLGLAKGFDADDLLPMVFLGSERPLLDAIIPILEGSSKNDQKAAAKLRAVLTFDLKGLALLEDVFVFNHKTKNPDQAKLNSFPTKNGRDAMPDQIDALQDFMKRVESTKPLRQRLLTKQKTLALRAFAQVFLPEYARQKELRGWLDFDDQIEKTRTLLRDRSMAQWVLFRLDGGIDHILVDEAQDTSPAQWDVIESLTQEMTSGDGARVDVERTIFVVGDPKQSIYSFQGADPSGFGRMRGVFKERLASVEKPFGNVQLMHSFRSSAAILETVDKVFDVVPNAALDGVVEHEAFKTDLPGRVDVFDYEPNVTQADDLPWHTPLDRISPADAKVLLAGRIARRIKHLVAGGATIPDDSSGRLQMRPVHEGDFLILVRRRKELFLEIIRACKAQGLKIAGPDRLTLGGETAVADLTALLSFLVTPEDDLSLASVLKSPLFGWSEKQLFELAHYRPDGTYLWRALQNNSALYAETVSVLEDLRNSADFMRPFDLLERILTRHDGRRAMVARLGPQAEDGIDALLEQALDYEGADIPNLTGFLTWLQVDDVDIKRQNDGPKDEIRVMTVHGAKGLEAPIVILPECGKHHRRNTPPVVLKTDEAFVWPSSASESPDLVRNAMTRAKDLEDEEAERLLYVAMTRAEKWLMIDGIGKDDKEILESWYGRIKQAVQTLGAKAEVIGDEAMTRYETGDWTLPAVKQNRPSAVTTSVPENLLKHPKPATERLKTIAPSGLGGSKAIGTLDFDVDEDDALRRGRLIHRLLEYLPDLPRSEWDRHADELLINGADFAEGLEAQQIKKDVFNVLNTPELAFLFTKGALSEVDISATLAQLQGGRVHGAIDRLIEFEDHVLAVDFKSNQIVPQNVDTIPEGLLRQMGAYDAALRIIFPDKPVKVALLWTTTAELMEVPHKMVSEALLRATLS